MVGQRHGRAAVEEGQHVPASPRSALPNSLVGARRTCQCRAPVSTRGDRGREGLYVRIRLDLLEASDEVHVFWPVHGRPFPELGTTVEDGEENEWEVSRDESCSVPAVLEEHGPSAELNVESRSA